MFAKLERLRWMFGASRGYGAGQFDHPYGVAIGGEGHIVVADTFNSRLQVLRPDGTHVRTIGSRGEGAGQFSYPSGVVFDGEGSIVVADCAYGRLQVLR